MYSFFAWAFVIVAAIFAWIKRALSGRSRVDQVIAFFHPHSAGRGGGERVLWAAIDGILSSVGKRTRIVIYSIDVNRDEILLSRQKAFGFPTKPNEDIITFKKVYFATLLDAKTWPVAAILGQSIGSVIVLLSALFTSCISDWPTVFIDTTGCPFTLPAAKLVTGAKVCAYVHYPTMSTDMLSKVSKGKADFNNSEKFAKNSILQFAKMHYYKLFLFLYKQCGRCVDVAVGNSKWTCSRIQQVWGRKDIAVLYPPAAIGENGVQIKSIQPDQDKGRKLALLSLAQFRPEKNHELQLRVFALVLKRCPEAVFWVMGGSRNAEDDALIERLKRVAFEDLKIPSTQIEFVVNASRADVNARLKTGKCAIHTMVDEHFGISLLEFLEARIPVVCHRSGGPESDILLPDEQFGYLATAESEFADKVVNVLKNFDSVAVKQKRVDGYNSLTRFYSDAKFGKEFHKIFIQ